MSTHLSPDNPIGFDVSLPPKERIQKYIDTYRNDPAYKVKHIPNTSFRHLTSFQGFESALMYSLNLISVHAQSPKDPSSASLATTIFELTVIPQLCNPMNNMHGGAVATLADMATTMAAAPIARKGFWEFGGVSRTLSVTYLRPVRLGRVVRVECQVRSVGRRLCKWCILLDLRFGDEC